MSILGPDHYELTNGVGKCSALMWWLCNDKYECVERLDGKDYEAKTGKTPFADGGFCDEAAYGRNPSGHSGGALLCPKHGGPNESGVGP